MLSATPSEHPGDSEKKWDAALHRLGGDLLQSWRWGVFKQRQGWNVSRVRVAGPDGEAMAQVLFRGRGPLSVAYLPRGPVVAEGAAVAAELLAAIDEACRHRRAVVLVVEPHRPLPSAWTGEASAFARGPASFQTARTLKVPLVADADLLAQMRRDTRANVLHAQRHGVTVERAPVEPSSIGIFNRLLQETSRRRGFGIHAPAYYAEFLRVFGDQAVLLFARVDGEVTAGLIAARCGDEARSMYAGSSTAHRARGDAALLRFAAMRWARDHGCMRYDLGGIAPAASRPEIGQEAGAGDRRGHDFAGVHRFKVGFGGEIVSYPPPVERRYRPVLAWLVRHLHPRFRTAPEQL